MTNDPPMTKEDRPVLPFVIGGSLVGHSSFPSPWREVLRQLLVLLQRPVLALVAVAAEAARLDQRLHLQQLPVRLGEVGRRLADQRLGQRELVLLVPLLAHVRRGLRPGEEGVPLALALGEEL